MLYESSAETDSVVALRMPIKRNTITNHQHNWFFIVWISPLIFFVALRSLDKDR